MFVGASIDRLLWNLACDIAVENAITELGLKSVQSKRESYQTSHIQKLKAKIKDLTAEKIYNHFKTNNYPPLILSTMANDFCADDHTIWYMSVDEKANVYGIGDSSQSNEDKDREGEDNGANIFISRAELDAEWQKISERMQVDIETFGKQRGVAPGSLMQNLKEVNREKYDYTAFLKKFAVMGEVMKINDDEFDYVFYTYGLKLYDRMPLIEPLEYKEVKRIKEFVLAIDTSGSTTGELVQRFVQKTYNVLKSTESFFSRINLHIIQCDANIQEHVKITSQEEFDEYLKVMKIHGLGGTDFRPVFELTDKLIKEKEFYNLKGLIYFTDGCGEFPTQKPNYETAFVFIDDEYNNYDVPPWAIKLILKSEEI
jgi:predicted metal-dependent peptidase